LVTDSTIFVLAVKLLGSTKVSWYSFSVGDFIEFFFVVAIAEIFMGNSYVPTLALLYFCADRL